MLNKVIFYQPKEYPEKKVILLENMRLPPGDYSYCKSIEEKINEYTEVIQLDITLFILEIEKKQYELYREPEEFAWILNNEIVLNEINNVIVLDGKNRQILLNSYNLFEPLYKRQLENIYHFLKTNYNIDQYFINKNKYNRLRQKFPCKLEKEVKKI